MSQSLVRSVLTVTLIGAVLAWAVPTRAEEKAEAAKHAKSQAFTGHIVSVDAKAGTIVVRHVTNTMKVSKTFKLDDKTKYVGHDKKAIAVGDLKTGDKVNVTYTGEEPALVAQEIAVVADGKGEAKKT